MTCNYPVLGTASDWFCYPDLSSDASSAWNFCTRFSDFISRRAKPVVSSRNVGCFLRLLLNSKQRSMQCILPYKKYTKVLTITILCIVYKESHFIEKNKGTFYVHELFWMLQCMTFYTLPWSRLKRTHKLWNAWVVPFAIAELGHRCLEAAPVVKPESSSSCNTLINFES